MNHIMAHAMIVSVMVRYQQIYVDIAKCRDVILCKNPETRLISSSYKHEHKYRFRYIHNLEYWYDTYLFTECTLPYGRKEKRYLNEYVALLLYLLCVRMYIYISRSRIYFRQICRSKSRYRMYDWIVMQVHYLNISYNDLLQDLLTMHSKMLANMYQKTDIQ